VIHYFLSLGGQLTKKLKELDRRQSRFFANISHEFRTLLTLIMGHVDDLLSQAQDAASEKKLHLILRSAGQRLELVNDLLELAKLEAGVMKLRAAPGKLIALLKIHLAKNIAVQRRKALL
jgi:signal transduction histidine kinase